MNQYENKYIFTELKQAILLVYCLHYPCVETLLRFLMQKYFFALKKSQYLTAIAIYILSLKMKLVEMLLIEMLIRRKELLSFSMKEK